MVIPFSSPDESLRALELIGRDPGARDVRVVIVDLSGAIIDEGFGAVALEQILDAIERWGAEPLLAGISPLSIRVLEDLERTHLVIHKDLPEAIAAGFQIAELHRVAS
jgi:anti-anti-sigma regulatory factor